MMLILFDAKKGRFVLGKGIIILWLQSKKHYDQIHHYFKYKMLCFHFFGTKIDKC